MNLDDLDTSFVEDSDVIGDHDKQLILQACESMAAETDSDALDEALEGWGRLCQLFLFLKSKYGLLTTESSSEQSRIHSDLKTEAISNGVGQSLTVGDRNSMYESIILNSPDYILVERRHQSLKAVYDFLSSQLRIAENRRYILGELSINRRQDINVQRAGV